MSDFEDASLILTPNAYKAGKAYCVKPFDGSGDLTVVRNTTATTRNESGLLESVGVNVPRVYFPESGGCPYWLIEPQSTNLIPYSEDFTDSSWGKQFSGTAIPAVVTPNTDISPDGNTTADNIVFNVGASGTSWVRQFYGETSGVEYVFSIYLKGNGVDVIGLGGSNLLKATITPTTSWQRYEITWTGSSTSTKRVGLYLQTSISTDSEVLAWGAQLEQGDLTSYIPTNGSTVTRNADVLTVAPPSGTTEIVETFSDNTTNTITTIPATYQLPNGEISKVIMK